MKGKVNALIWYLQRFTGIFLVVVLGIHFWVLHFANKTGEYLYKEVAERLTTPGWRAFYIFFLAIVIYHAMVGLRMILNDFRFPSYLRSLFSVILFLLGVGLFVWGMSSLFSVQLPG